MSSDAQICRSVGDDVGTCDTIEGAGGREGEGGVEARMGGSIDGGEGGDQERGGADEVGDTDKSFLSVTFSSPQKEVDNSILSATLSPPQRARRGAFQGGVCPLGLSICIGAGVCVCGEWEARLQRAQMDVAVEQERCTELGEQLNNQVHMHGRWVCVCTCVSLCVCVCARKCVVV